MTREISEGFCLIFQGGTFQEKGPFKTFKATPRQTFGPFFRRFFVSVDPKTSVARARGPSSSDCAIPLWLELWIIL